MQNTIIRQYVPVERMYKGDTFLTNRSGTVTAVSDPYPNPDGGSTFVIDVRKQDGTVFPLIGVNRYTVETIVVS